MNNESPRHPEDQDIDLAMISKKIGNFFQSLSDAIFDMIQFTLKHKFLILTLLIVGFIVGYFIDVENKSYDNQFAISPNLGSADYVYSKIDLLEAKIKERDTTFLKSIGLKKATKITNIEIEPITDIFQFISTTNDKNFEVLKLMAEDSDFKKTVEDRATSKNFRYHVITFTTRSKTSNEESIEPLMKYFNNSEFYLKIQNQYVENIHTKIKANEVIIAQIDAFLNSLPNGADASSNKAIFVNENSQLNDVIETKDKLLKEQGNLKIELVSLSKPIREISQTLNVKNTKAANGKLKIILPFFLIGFYILIHFFISFYKKQTLRRAHIL